ncbi:MAG: hypothetical protein ACR2KT_10090 [Methylocella sp.]
MCPIAAGRDDLAVADDERAEGKVRFCGLGDGDPHEMLAARKGRHLRRACRGLARRAEGGPGEAPT